jgi:hypothetical protein
MKLLQRGRDTIYLPPIATVTVTRSVNGVNIPTVKSCKATDGETTGPSLNSFSVSLVSTLTHGLDHKSVLGTCQLSFAICQRQANSVNARNVSSAICQRPTHNAIAGIISLPFRIETGIDLQLATTIAYYALNDTQSAEPLYSAISLSPPKAVTPPQTRKIPPSTPPLPQHHINLTFKNRDRRRRFCQNQYRPTSRLPI